jgi:hypothetical protein
VVIRFFADVDFKQLVNFASVKPIKLIYDEKSYTATLVVDVSELAVKVYQFQCSSVDHQVISFLEFWKSHYSLDIKSPDTSDGSGDAFTLQCKSAATDVPTPPLSAPEPQSPIVHALSQQPNNQVTDHHSINTPTPQPTAITEPGDTATRNLVTENATTTNPSKETKMIVHILQNKQKPPTTTQSTPSFTHSRSLKPRKTTQSTPSVTHNPSLKPPKTSQSTPSVTHSSLKQLKTAAQTPLSKTPPPLSKP